MKSAPSRKKPAAAQPSRRRIMIVDDHPFMRAGLAQLIDRQPDLMVCCEAANPAEALQRLAAGGADLVLADMTMPGRSGLDFLKDIVALHPGLPVLVVSMHDELVYAERALRAGARGYIMKEAGGDNLLAAIRQIFEGLVYVSPRMSALLLDSFSGRKAREADSPFGKLTDREFEIFQLIGRGRDEESRTDLHSGGRAGSRPLGVVSPPRARGRGPRPGCAGRGSS